MSSAFLTDAPNSGKAAAAITFDEFSKLRILDPSLYEASEKLKDECKDFTSKINDFNSIAHQFLEVLEDKAKHIELVKLRAIGQRNQVEKEVENRKTKQKELTSVIRERQAELERLVVQSESLFKVTQEQQSWIDSLSSK